ncbi:hypothetical protein FSARC_1899 [Fusarium sarcochroum]|uniref:Uncharacterized protein n=1 Tax=Fusarium sarcochroum TaxID=1208366 RepID=A0A8H4XDK0_9HYPO|nr:hypothetical protein FSARC_1899 [Fusarium sarcochroum]
MQDSYTGTFREQAQLVRAGRLPLQACFSESFSSKVIRAAGTPGRILASINEFGGEWKQRLRKLRQTQENTEEALQAQDTAGESSNQSRERPIISTPIVAPQQPPSTQAGPASGNTQAPFQQRNSTSRPGSQREALGSHPVHAPGEHRQNEQSGDGGSQVEATHSPRPEECPLHAEQDEEIRRLRNRVSELRCEREKLKGDVSSLESKISVAKSHVFTDHCRAYAWESVGPAPDAGALLLAALAGLRMIMLKMRSRIEWYENRHPTLRKDYDDAHQV